VHYVLGVDNNVESFVALLSDFANAAVSFLAGCSTRDGLSELRVTLGVFGVGFSFAPGDRWENPNPTF